MAELVNAYMQLGVMGLIVVVGLWLLVWYFTKGKKQSEESKLRLIEEYARIGKVVENNTAVINNCSKVIEANTIQRKDEKRCLEAIAERMGKHGEQLDELLSNQRICMDRQNRK